MGVTQPAVSVVGSAFDTLQPRLSGYIIVPGDVDYDSARKPWNLSFDPHPALIVVAKNAADVAEAVRFARHQGLEIAVQSTGHGVARVADGGMLLLTSQLRGMRINVEAQTAWLEAGLKWGAVLSEAQRYGLAPLLGSSPDVGVVGYTLGGGYGWLGRKYGLSADSVIRFEVVTAEGEIVTASADENPDLFWALRGGGGSFGIVTGMEIKLYPVSVVYGGNLYYPVSQAAEVIRRYREWIKTVPDELTSSFVLMNFPPFPEVPEIIRGKSFVMVRGVYAGPIEEGEALLKYWREWQTPVIDDWKVMPFTDIEKVSDEPLDPVAVLSTTVWLRELSDAAIDTLIRYAVPAGGPPPVAITEVRHVGGAVAKVDPNATAYSNRDATLLLHLIGIAPTPEAYQALKKYTGQLKLELLPYTRSGVYMNFLEGDEKLTRTMDAYPPETYRRLRAVKGKYDPENVFSYSFNIPPAKAAE